jgi:hypothetical protein
MKLLKRHGGPRTLPRERCGKKPERTWFKRAGDKDELDDALRAWESKQPNQRPPSEWDRFKRVRAIAKARQRRPI